MQLAISPDDFHRLEPYLPTGMAGGPSSTPVERAAGFLARLVLSHRVTPGQKVPMDEIALHIGASRTPVREALRRLETEGLVASLPNRGFILRRLEAVEVSQLYEARQCIEAFVARRAFERRNPGFLDELGSLHGTYEHVLRGPGDCRRLGMLVDKAFHVRIARQAGNPHLTASLSNMFDRLILTRPIEDFPLGRMGEAVAEHALALARFQSGTVDEAEAALVHNIRNGCEAIVAHLRSPLEFPVSIGTR
ncbi:MAG TPA: GntR family transcriptional regulator [Usitatibacter sp.]|jgi:DNA-binding GntR family transcriptional regulator|nr:GntR family transcriptional regulator [Usitatibacter sp.]